MLTDSWWRVYKEVFAFYLDPENARRRSSVKDLVYGSSLWKRITFTFWYFKSDLQAYFSYRKTYLPELSGKDWVVAGTGNQEVSLQFLLKEANFVGVPHGLSRDKRWTENLINWSPVPVIFHLWRYLAFFIKVCFQNPSNFVLNFSNLISGVGCYENNVKVLRQYRPRRVIVANDHTPFYRSLVLAAIKLDIPTIYLQHACASVDFPRLLCDHSLLDGMDAKNKYLREGMKSRGRVKLMGIPRFDPYFPLINRSNNLTKLGLPYSKMDDPGIVSKLIEKISKAFPELEISVRAHPSDPRPFPSPNNSRWAWSTAAEETAFDFLRRQDAIISSVSAIHLEAVLLNVTSIYFELGKKGDKIFDIYNFAAHGLVDLPTTEKELLDYLGELIQERPYIRHRATYYCATCETEWDGKSATLVKRYLGENV